MNAAQVVALVLLIASIALVAVGAALIYFPAGLIAGGAGLGLLAVFFDLEPPVRGRA